MTSLSLSIWIAASVLLQIAIYLCIGFWRHWLAYNALRNVVAESEITVNPEVTLQVIQPAPAAWSAYHTFRVERKVQEDDLAQVCSIYPRQ